MRPPRDVAWAGLLERTGCGILCAANLEMVRASVQRIIIEGEAFGDGESKEFQGHFRPSITNLNLRDEYFSHPRGLLAKTQIQTRDVITLPSC